MLQPDALRKACAAVSHGLKEYPHLSEAVYQRALQVELLWRDDVYAVETEVVLPVEYRGQHVGTVRVDLRVHPETDADHPCAQKAIIELKRAPKITQSHIDQLNTYLALSMRQAGNIVHGAVVNFGVHPPQIHFEDGHDLWHKRNRDLDPNPNRTRSPSCATSRSRSRSRSPERKPEVDKIHRSVD